MAQLENDFQGKRKRPSTIVLYISNLDSSTPDNLINESLILLCAKSSTQPRQTVEGAGIE